MKNILVVDDSALMRRVLCDIINNDERFQVQDRAVDGLEALELLCVKNYDAVVLDINMPRMGGVELLRELHERNIPARILIISASADRSAPVTFDALELGALDFVQKPGNALDCRLGEFKDSLLNTLAVVADSKMPAFEKLQLKAADKSRKQQNMPFKIVDIGGHVWMKVPEKPKEATQAKAPEKPRTKASERPQAKVPEKPEPKASERPQAKASERPQPRPSAKPQSGADGRMPRQQEKPPAGTGRSIPNVKESRIVAIASSTGGPKALQSLIPKLPGNLNAPVVIVQHMPEGFTASLSVRLNNLSEINVKEAAEGDVLEAGTVYIAKGGKHLNIVTKSGKSIIHYTDEPNREGVKPCANYMYESLSDSRYDRIVCVVMTGMGADGTKGIRSLKEKKELYVIAQEASTCAVYGMPRSIVDSGLADKVAPLEQLAQEIIMNVGVK